MKRWIVVLMLGGCLAWSPAYAAQSKPPKVHSIHRSKTAKKQAKRLKKEQAKARKQAKVRAKRARKSV